MTTLLNECLKEWKCKIEYRCNVETSQQKTILKEIKDDNVTIVLRGNDGKYFVEEYKGKTMYPAVYKVFCEESANEVTEEEYQCWLNEKSK